VQQKGITMKEIWKDIKNFEGYYQVSNLGRIRSITRKVSVVNGSRTTKGQILKPLKTKNGYYRIDLRLNQSHNYFLIHRLVAQTFIPNPNNYPYINHKDSNPLNNNVNNLEWCTQSYNIKYAYTNGNAKPTAGCFKKGCIPHNLSKVAQYDKQGNLIEIYASVKLASKSINRTTTSIFYCLAGRTKSCGGYIWRYAND
jgi:hypothetical protein